LGGPKTPQRWRWGGDSTPPVLTGYGEFLDRASTGPVESHFAAHWKRHDDDLGRPYCRCSSAFANGNAAELSFDTRCVMEGVARSLVEDRPVPSLRQQPQWRFKTGISGILFREDRLLCALFRGFGVQDYGLKQNTRAIDAGLAARLDVLSMRRARTWVSSRRMDGLRPRGQRDDFVRTSERAQWAAAGARMVFGFTQAEVS